MYCSAVLNALPSKDDEQELNENRCVLYVNLSPSQRPRMIPVRMVMRSGSLLPSGKDLMLGYIQVSNVCGGDHVVYAYIFNLRASPQDFEIPAGRHLTASEDTYPRQTRQIKSGKSSSEACPGPYQGLISRPLQSQAHTHTEPCIILRTSCVCVRE